MSFKSRLLTTAFVLPVTGWLALAPSQAFDLTGEADDTEYTTTVEINPGSTPADGESIIINGTPGTSDAALIVNDDVNVVLDGVITIRDRNEDDDATPFTNAYGVKITAPMSGGNSVRLKDAARISIIEVRGPDYDRDDDNDTLPDANDDDEDGIIEGSPALAGDNFRIGLSVENTIAADTAGYALIGENGSLITVEGNAENVGDVAGVKIGAGLTGHLDLSTQMNIFGDNARGVDINNTIGGNYRQRGDIDVRGANTVGIDVGAEITGSLMIEGDINATGYSTIPSGTPGGPTRGGEDRDETNEFDDTRRGTNPYERRQSRAAVEVGANIGQGLIIGGVVDR